MQHVGLLYTEIENMPFEYVEWFYRKQINEEQQAANSSGTSIAL